MNGVTAYPRPELGRSRAEQGVGKLPVPGCARFDLDHTLTSD